MFHYGNVILITVLLWLLILRSLRQNSTLIEPLLKAKAGGGAAEDYANSYWNPV
jgi:hypothetical protein